MGTKQLSRREKERLRHRDEILGAALSLFSKNGYHNVSMHEIAQKSEFAVGTVYKFFENKEDLYKALLMDTAREYHAVLKDVLASGTSDIAGTVEEYVSAKARFFANRVDVLRLYFAETRGASFNIKAGLDHDLRMLHDEVVEELASVFKAGVRKKMFRRLDPHYMAVALEGITNSFLFCWLETPEQHSYEANVPLITEMFLKGVLAK